MLAKKLINHLKHTSRTLKLGENIVHMNHLQMLLQKCSHLEHGLREEDVERRDRMNWESAQRLMFPKVRQSLYCMVNDGVALENIAGTAMYLEICWMYTDIFLSHTATLLQRVQYASCVANFLRIWRLWIFQQSDLKLSSYFISGESFQDTLISCHFVVLHGY